MLRCNDIQYVRYLLDRIQLNPSNEGIAQSMIWFHYVPFYLFLSIFAKEAAAVDRRKTKIAVRKMGLACIRFPLARYKIQKSEAYFTLRHHESGFPSSCLNYSLKAEYNIVSLMTACNDHIYYGQMDASVSLSQRCSLASNGCMHPGSHKMRTVLSRNEYLRLKTKDIVIQPYKEK